MTRNGKTFRNLGLWWKEAWIGRDVEEGAGVGRMGEARRCEVPNR